MANVQHPGFLPVSHGSETVECVRKLVLTNNTDRIAKGDAIDATASGDVIAHTTEDGEVYSVMMLGSYVANGERLERTFVPAATTYSGTAVNNERATYIHVVEDIVNTRFRASIDEAVALTDLNLNFAMVLTVATENFSLHEVDATGKNTTATLPWRLEDFIIGDPKVDPTAADAHCLFRVNAGNGRNPALEIGGSLGL